MTDFALRELERRFAAGDLSVEAPLAAARIRAGISDLQEELIAAILRRGPIVRWQVSFEHPGTLTITPPDTSWGFWITATPWWDDDEGVPVQAHSNSGHSVCLRSWKLPNTWDVTILAESYRQQAFSMITSYLPSLLLARVTQSCACSTFPEPNCPAHGDMVNLIGD